MAYQFTQTGAQIQSILDQVPTNTSDISTINNVLTSKLPGNGTLVNNMKCITVSGNKTTIKIAFTGSGQVYGPVLILAGSHIFYVMLSPTVTSVTRVVGSTYTMSISYDSATLTYTLTNSNATQIAVICGGGAGISGAITIS